MGVPMPTSDMYRKTVKRVDLVRRFGEATVTRAELTAVMNVLIASGIVRSPELADIIIAQCTSIEKRRRTEAHLDEDRG